MKPTFASALMLGILLGASATSAHATDWIEDRYTWGVRGGIKFGIYPGSVDENPDGGPLGLIRVGFPALPGGGYALINFIAIEPLVGKLSQSEMDHMNFTADPPVHITLPDGVEQLDVTIHPDRFANGAHVSVTASIRADQRNEIRFRIHAEPDSAPIQQCTLTATMGNMTRVRELHLRGQVLKSHQLYGSYRGDGFADDRFFPASQLDHQEGGDTIVRFAGDEPDPAASVPMLDNWWYRGSKITQYWKKPVTSPARNLQLRVNGRSTYWASQVEIPGGISFENVDLRDDFVDGEDFVYGIAP